MNGEVVAYPIVGERGTVCCSDLSAWARDVEVEGARDFLGLRGGGCGGFGWGGGWGCWFLREGEGGQEEGGQEWDGSFEREGDHGRFHRKVRGV
jgi:hypothetical protein